MARGLWLVIGGVVQLTVRKVFKNFAKYKDCFLGIDVEALFVGTIIYSLDHTMMDWNLEDPL